MTEENSIKKSKDHIIPDRQRALVLQGGGALGAYEVGVTGKCCVKSFLKVVETTRKMGRYLILLQAVPWVQ